MKTQFTPGPWVIDTETRPAEVCTVHHTSHENGYVYVRGELGYWEADGDENMANAHLIAAAPELWHELYETHCALMFKDPEYLGSERYKKNAVVLAKARGDQP